VVQVWRCAAGGRHNTSTFLSRIALKGGALSGLLWKTTASPSPRSGRQPGVRIPNWVESPTSLEVMEARVLLAEIYLLKERALTTEAVVADFIFKNIQPLKDRAYPAYLYSGITDSTRVTNKKIPTEDLVS
jgi:hypothetical protein